MGRESHTERYAECSIDNCLGNAHWSARGSRGLCAKHHHRLKVHGDPLAGRTPVGKPERFINEVVLTCDLDECLIWPFAKTSAGYAHIRIDGKTVLVSRIACEDAHGKPDDPSLEAAHSCGNGHLGCVNRKHLSWKTTTANHADKIGHGTLNWGETHHLAKLTEENVRFIRSSDLDANALAEMFGCDPTNIRTIRRGGSWKHVA